jgi:site-specific DNA-methyltransferase (adenine-specific)
MKKVVSRIDVLAPNEICSESYLLLGCYDTKEEAEHLVSYMKTRFVRFLLSNLLLTQNIAKDKFQLIPIRDFTREWNDFLLYEKYELTEKERQYIEDLIKPI